MFAVPERMKHYKITQRKQSPCGITKPTTLIYYIYANVLKSSPSLCGSIRKMTRNLVRPSHGYRRCCIYIQQTALTPEDHRASVSPKGKADREGSLRGGQWPSLHSCKYSFTCQQRPNHDQGTFAASYFSVFLHCFPQNENGVLIQKWR